MKNGIAIVVIFVTVFGMLYMNKDKISTMDGSWTNKKDDVIEISDGAHSIKLGAICVGTPNEAKSIKVDKARKIVTFTVNGENDIEKVKVGYRS